MPMKRFEIVLGEVYLVRQSRGPVLWQIQALGFLV
jgi:hypothetical protein